MPDELDRLLDDALSAFAAAPERPGLEERLLTRTRKAKDRRKHWIAYASLAAALVVALLFITSPRFNRQSSPPHTIEGTAAALPPITPVYKVALEMSKIPTKRVIRKRLAEPKRYVFPTPSSLSEQEIALIEIANSQPAQLDIVSRPMQPLNVPLIHIDPLDRGKN